jgi:serine/threonine protein kinase
MEDVVEEAELPYVHVRKLGHGHSGTVEEVRVAGTAKTYARKTNGITGSQKNRAEKIRVYRNEVKIIHGLDVHHHVINVYDMYVTKKDFGILLEPVASNDDLEEFLAEYVQEAEQLGTSDARIIALAEVIEQCFGCLATGLAFMHEERI